MVFHRSERGPSSERSGNGKQASSPVPRFGRAAHRPPGHPSSTHGSSRLPDAYPSVRQTSGCLRLAVPAGPSVRGGHGQAVAMPAYDLLMSPNLSGIARPARRATRPAGHTRRLAAFGIGCTLGSHELNWAGTPDVSRGTHRLPENPGALAPPLLSPCPCYGLALVHGSGGPCSRLRAMRLCG
jgi:hypothetical protein